MRMPPVAAIVFAAAVFSTFFVTAVNAYTLTIGYPLWRFTGEEAFARLHAEYLRRLNSVITIPHVVMFFATSALVFVRPRGLSLEASLAVAVLAWLVVGVSAFVAGPVHSRFTAQGRVDEPGMRLLLRVSAARTGMMLAASALLLRTLLGLVN